MGGRCLPPSTNAYGSFPSNCPPTISFSHISPSSLLKNSQSPPPPPPDHHPSLVEVGICPLLVSSSIGFDFVHCPISSLVSPSILVLNCSDYPIVHLCFYLIIFLGSSFLASALNGSGAPKPTRGTLFCFVNFIHHTK